MLGAMKHATRLLLVAAALGLGAAPSFAQVKVEGAWARPTVAGQQGGGGFLAITSPVADRLLGGSTPVAQRVELHTMSMQGDVMQMRQLDAIDLPAGKKVEFKPGGVHVMFIGIKRPLALGSKVPVRLKFEKAGDVSVDFEVTSRPAMPAMPMHKH